jgi:hypothetical protein
MSGSCLSGPSPSPRPTRTRVRVRSAYDVAPHPVEPRAHTPRRSAALFKPRALALSPQATAAAFRSRNPSTPSSFAACHCRASAARCAAAPPLLPLRKPPLELRSGVRMLPSHFYRFTSAFSHSRDLAVVPSCTSPPAAVSGHFRSLQSP